LILKMNIKELRKQFVQLFGQEPLVVKSPGRVNIIGEHTDYNNGFVLPAAIDKSAYLAISLRDDDEIHLVALDLNEKFQIQIKDLRPIGDISWPNFILGVVAQFIKKSITVKGFNAVLISEVPIGAGLSSSAAIECATTFALNELLQTNLARITMINMAQKAEHEYAGVMCGIMDQFASMMGKKDHVIKLDCKTLDYEYIPFKLEGLQIILLNTNVKHSLASSEYNTRRLECMKAVEWIKESNPSVNSLRDATIDMLKEHVLNKDSLVYQRAEFIVEEISRLQQACIDLENVDINALGAKMFATHYGLSQKYEVSCKELDFLVNATKNNNAVIGSRMMGGGFGGCTINLVKEKEVEELISIIKPHYEEAMSLPLSCYVVTIANGTEIIK
jgi:galactokinase